MNLIKYLMKVFYANENYLNSGVKGLNYFMALTMATFYVLLTAIMVLFILSAVFPLVEKFGHFLINQTPIMPTSILVVVILFFLLRIGFKEQSLVDQTFTKDYVKKSLNYIIAYGFTVGVVIIFVSLKLLPKN